MFKEDDIVQNLSSELKSTSRMARRHVVTHGKVRLPAGMTSDIPQSSISRRSEPLPPNVKRVFHF